MRAGHNYEMLYCSCSESLAWLWHNIAQFHKEHSEMWLNIATGSKLDDWIMGHNGKGNPNCNSTLWQYEGIMRVLVHVVNLLCAITENLSPHKAWGNWDWFRRGRSRSSETCRKEALAWPENPRLCTHLIQPRRRLLLVTLGTFWQQKYWRFFPFSKQSRTSLVNCNSRFFPQRTTFKSAKFQIGNYHLCGWDLPRGKLFRKLVTWLVNLVTPLW